MTTNTDRATYVATARKEVEDCLERAVQQGWKPTPSVFVSSYDAQCCALGAIALCHKDMPTPTEYRLAIGETMPALGSDYQCYALSKQHLGCTQWELESIEAGFEDFANEWNIPEDVPVRDLEDMAVEDIDDPVKDESFFQWWHAVEEKLHEGALGTPFDPDFYAMGQAMRDKYRVEEDEDEEDEPR